MAQLNPTELVILKYLWSSGPQSARQLHEAVGPAQNWKASTSRTVANRMVAKGWLEREEIDGVSYYRPLIGRVETIGNLVRHLTRSVLDMNTSLPAAMFADSPHLSEDELDELDAIINAASEGDEA